MSYRVEQLARVTMMLSLVRSTVPAYAVALNNARIESALVHGRALAYFLRADAPGKGDLHIWHYSKSAWKDGSLAITSVASKVIKQASKHLAHAAIGDQGWEPHPGAWPLPEMAMILSRGLSDFVHALEVTHPDRAALFGEQPSEAYHSLIAQVPGFGFTEISDHPEVADLTRSLQAYILDNH